MSVREPGDVVRWGVIGAGPFAQARSLPGLKAARHARLQAVMVRDGDRAQEIAGRLGAPEAYADVEDLLASPQVDAVYICTPVDQHRAHTLRAAAAGKHVLCEKPMAISVPECLDMVQTCRAQGVRLGVGYMMRYRPQCQVAQAMIAEGRLGDLVAGRAQNVGRFDLPSSAWRRDPDRGGGGALVDVGSHCIDTLRFLIGEVQAVRGQASSARDGLPFEDTAQVLLTFENQALGMVDCSWSIPGRECPLEIYGTQGSLLVTHGLGPFTDPDMRLLTAQGTFDIPLPAGDAYAAEFEAMSLAILEGRDPGVDGWEGLRITEILQATYRSIRGGLTVSLPAAQRHFNDRESS